MEQYTRKHNLEIHGIAETADENIAENVVKLGKVVNVHISPSDIDICHRMGPRNSSGPKPIIVRFKSHKKKTELYKISIFMLQTWYISIKILHHLRRKLFAKVRKFKKDNHWHSAWTLDGKIFIEKSQEEQPKIIHAEGDLTKISKLVFFFFYFSPRLLNPDANLLPKIARKHLFSILFKLFTFFALHLATFFSLKFTF